MKFSENLHEEDKLPIQYHYMWYLGELPDSPKGKGIKTGCSRCRVGSLLLIERRDREKGTLRGCKFQVLLQWYTCFALNMKSSSFSDHWKILSCMRFEKFKSLINRIENTTKGKMAGRTTDCKAYTCLGRTWGMPKGPGLKP